MPTITMKKLLVLVFLAFGTFSFAQKNVYKEVDDYVKSIKIPIITPKNLESMAHLVADKFEIDSLKARAIFDFVSSYYDYDYDMVKEGFGKATEQGLGVCWQYAQLFSDMADVVGLKTLMIYGWSKTTIKDIGKVNKKSYHAWNMVEINGQWRPLDCTWASGYIDKKSKEFVHELDGHYYLTNKELFSLNHHPDSGFQYVAYSAQSLENFIAAPLYITRNFPKEFYFKPSGVKMVDYSTSKTPKVTFEFVGEMGSGAWTYSDLKEKTEYVLQPEVSNGTITFTFPEELGVESYLSLRYGKKTLVTMAIGN